MKKLIFNLFLLSLIACNKQVIKENAIEESKEEQSTGNNLRNAGETKYYSIDEEYNIVYEMIVKKLENGNIEVIRTINNDIHSGLITLNQIDGDVNYKVLNDDSLEVSADSLLNTYLIPFNPSDSIQCIVAGGGDKFMHDCKCELSVGTSPTCTETSSKAENGTLTLSCKAKDCQTCKLKITRVKSGTTGTKFTYIGGFIILTGNDITEN